MVDRQVHPARAAELVRVLLDGVSDGRVVDDRVQLHQVVDQQAVEQHFVSVLQARHELVLVQVGRTGLQLCVRPVGLLLQSGRCGGQPSDQAELGALSGGERGPAVGKRILKHGWCVSRHEKSSLSLGNRPVREPISPGDGLRCSRLIEE